MTAHGGICPSRRRASDPRRRPRISSQAVGDPDRIVVLVVAALFIAVPVALLLAPRRAGSDSAPGGRRRLDPLWTALPIVFLVALIVLAGAA